jgi:hypothetical protein
MLWQCSTCLLKYIANPIGASISFTSDLKMAPLVITICNKGLETDYKFPELKAIEGKGGHSAEWKTIWNPNSSSVTVDTFSRFIPNIVGPPRLCKTIHLYERLPTAVKIRHQYGCKFENLAAYLHKRGMLLSEDFTLLLQKNMFLSYKKYMLELNIETVVSLPTAELNCNEDESAKSLDTCLLTNAIVAANSSVGCITKYLR